MNTLASTAHNSLAASIEAGDPSIDSRFDIFKDFLIKGEWLNELAPQRIVIGSGMANKLNVDIGNKIVFMSSNDSGQTIAHMGRVAGIFQSNFEDIDKFFVFSTLNFGQQFIENKPNSVSRISITLDNPDALSLVQKELISSLQQYDVEILTWESLMPEVLQFITVDDAGGYIFLGLILIMVIFGVANTLFMSVLERTREFALLNVIGLSKLNLVITIFVETLFLSFVSLLIGWVLAGGIHYYFATHGIDVSGATENSLQIAGTVMDPVVYSKLTVERAIQFTTIAFLSAMIVGIYPAIRASKVAPIRALQS